MAVGLPLHNTPMLNKEIGGNLEGNITLVGGLSGVGKTALSRILLLPSILEHKEKIIIMINEEGKKKWQREFIVWIANNIFKEDLQKYIVRDGKYKPEVKALLKKCSEWIKQYKNTIILKPFTQYTTAKAIKTIKKYSSMGVKYFMLDTFKADAKTLSSEAFWFSMQQNMVEINDVIKAEAKNVHIWITFQLSKSSSKQRYYDQDNIGMAKNIVDVASTCLMIRKVFDDELEGGKRELDVYRREKRQGNIETQIPVKLKKGKNYQIIFIVKNREGSTNEYQIIVEHDLSRNIYKEVGYTVVPVDF
jgi:replicative DNA helicase